MYVNFLGAIFSDTFAKSTSKLLESSLSKVKYEVDAVAVNLISKIEPSPKSAIVKVVLKFCVPAGEVPTCIFKLDPLEELSINLTCNLYSLFFTVDRVAYAAAAFNLSLPFPVAVYAGVPDEVVQLVMLLSKVEFVTNSVGTM